MLDTSKLTRSDPPQATFQILWQPEQLWTQAFWDITANACAVRTRAYAHRTLERTLHRRSIRNIIRGDLPYYEPHLSILANFMSMKRTKVLAALLYQ